ncbi:MAG: hypothetical protein IPO53_09975 [Chitinophagaceae bacterium]|nr:hypothetical protein [Chitinophagaceae bacterium]
MNKLFIGLLIVAAGAGTFLLLRKKKDSTETNDPKKEWILGAWKTDAVTAADSNFNKYVFDFQKSGDVIRTLNDSVKADTSHYEWNKAGELLWKKNAGDSATVTYTVLKLTSDSLQILSKDSLSFLFTKIK